MALDIIQDWMPDELKRELEKEYSLVFKRSLKAQVTQLAMSEIKKLATATVSDFISVNSAAIKSEMTEKLNAAFPNIKEQVLNTIIERAKHKVEAMTARHLYGDDEEDYRDEY